MNDFFWWFKYTVWMRLYLWFRIDRADRGHHEDSPLMHVVDGDRMCGRRWFAAWRIRRCTYGYSHRDQTKYHHDERNGHITYVEDRERSRVLADMVFPQHELPPVGAVVEARVYKQVATVKTTVVEHGGECFPFSVYVDAGGKHHKRMLRGCHVTVLWREGEGEGEGEGDDRDE